MIFRAFGRAAGRLRQSRTLAAIGGTALALALGVVALPWLFPASLFRPIASVVAAPATVALFGLLAGLLGAQALRETATTGEPPDRWSPTRDPERAHYEKYRTAGHAVDSILDADPAETAQFHARRREARERIRDAAITVLAADEDVDRGAAADRIAAGRWTDDPRAAAFLGGREHAPLGLRIRDWASGRRFERGAAAATAEIERLANGERRSARTARGDRPEPRPREGRQ